MFLFNVPALRLLARYHRRRGITARTLIMESTSGDGSGSSNPLYINKKPLDEKEREKKQSTFSRGRSVNRFCVDVPRLVSSSFLRAVFRKRVFPLPAPAAFRSILMPYLDRACERDGNERTNQTNPCSHADLRFPVSASADNRALFIYLFVSSFFRARA